MPNKQTNKALFEVLTRQPSGRETVRRVVASSEAEARQAVVDSGVPDDQIVEASLPDVT